MNRFKKWIYVSSLLILSGCHFGPQIQDISDVRRPQGASVELVIYVDGQRQSDRYLGELIAVDENGIIIVDPRLTNPRLVFVAWSEIYRVQAIGLDGRQVRAGPYRNASTRGVERMRSISRYPQGLTEALLARLLANYGQQSLLPMVE